MTMHAVLGDGEMTRRELTATLADLLSADENADQSFWFLVQGKSDPTETDRTLVTWLEKNEIYYEVVTDDPESLSDIYGQPQEVHTAKKISQKVVSLMQSKPEEGEPAEILALFADLNDSTAEEDRWLNGVIQAAFDAGFPTRALNDGLVEIDLSEEAAAAEAEPVKAVAATKKAVAKKVAVADTAVSGEDATVTDITPANTPVVIPSRAALEDMEPSMVKEVALSLGIVLPPRTRATTYIEHILGEAKSAPVAEVAPEPAPVVDGAAGWEDAPSYTPPHTNGDTNGDLDPDVVAEKVADLIWKRIQKAFIS